MGIGTPAMTGEMVRGHNQSHSRVDKPHEDRIHAQNIDEAESDDILSTVLDEVVAESELMQPQSEVSIDDLRAQCVNLNIRFTKYTPARALELKIKNYYDSVEAKKRAPAGATRLQTIIKTKNEKKKK